MFVKPFSMPIVTENCILAISYTRTCPYGVSLQQNATMLFTDVYEYNKLLSLIRSKAHVAYESLETQKNPIVTLESVLGLFRE